MGNQSDCGGCDRRVLGKGNVCGSSYRMLKKIMYQLQPALIDVLIVNIETKPKHGSSDRSALDSRLEDPEFEFL